MAYFERVGPSAFRATEHVSGAWDPADQHIAPALGLLVHCLERDHHARRDQQMVAARLSFDILGPIPVDVVEVGIRLLRPGRTIELVEATLVHGGRDAVRAQIWLLKTAENTVAVGAPFPPMPPIDEMEPWDPSSIWPGGFIASVEIRRRPLEPGRAQYWARARVPILDGEDVSVLARTAALLDVSNGMSVRADPSEVAFPNVDLTAHLFSQPTGEWIGFDTTVAFDRSGVGLTHSILHDATGPIGASSQCLTIRAR